MARELRQVRRGVHQVLLADDEVVGLAYSKAEPKGQQRHDVLVHLCCSGLAVLGRVPALLLTKDLSTQNLSARADCYAKFRRVPLLTVGVRKLLQEVQLVIK